MNISYLNFGFLLLFILGIVFLTFDFFEDISLPSSNWAIKVGDKSVSMESYLAQISQLDFNNDGEIDAKLKESVIDQLVIEVESRLGLLASTRSLTQSSEVGVLESHLRILDF